MAKHKTPINHSKCTGHVVKTGECLSKIIQQHGKPYDLNLNNLNKIPNIAGNEGIKDINLIYPGQFIHFTPHVNDYKVTGDLHVHFHFEEYPH